MPYRAVVFSDVHQHESVIITYISSLSSLLSPTPIPRSRWSQNARPGSLCYIAASCWLSVLHVIVVLSVLLSQFVIAFPSPAVCSSLFSTSVSPSLLCK